MDKLNKEKEDIKSTRKNDGRLDTFFDKRTNIAWGMLNEKINSCKKQMTNEEATDCLGELNENNEDNWRKPTLEDLYSFYSIRKKLPIPFPSVNNLLSCDTNGNENEKEIKYWTIDFSQKENDQRLYKLLSSDALYDILFVKTVK